MQSRKSFTEEDKYKGSVQNVDWKQQNSDIGGFFTKKQNGKFTNFFMFAI